MGIPRSCLVLALAIICYSLLVTKESVATPGISLQPPIPTIEATMPVADLLPNCKSGTLVGAWDVDSSGQANYSIPLSVSPGSAGMEPKLSLSYESNLDDSELGVGWKLGGLSLITRCPRMPAFDGAIGTVNFDLDDRFCIDGQRLVLVNGSYGGDGAEYRTEPDSYRKIVSYGNYQNTGPEYFKVWNKDGRVSEYGGNAQSLQGRIFAHGINPLTGGVRVWAVSQISDRTGKYIEYRYGWDPSISEYWIDEIRYTGHLPICSGQFCIAKPPYNKIRFKYETRPDSFPRFFGGTWFQSTKRLTNIKTYVASDSRPLLVTDYRISYETGNATQRSRISKITQCPASGSCLPATNITWQDWPSLQTQATSEAQWGSGFGGSVTTAKHSYHDSFSIGLGFARIQGTTVGGIRTTGSGFSTQPQLGITYTGTFVTQNLQISQAKLGDFNGDGRTDAAQVTTNGDIYVWLSNGTQFVSQGLWGTGLGTPGEVKVADVSGDGLDDLLWFPNFANAPAIVSVSTGNGFQAAAYWTVNAGPIDRVIIGDFNGDRLADLATLVPTAIPQILVHLSYGSGFSSPVVWASGVTNLDEVKISDVNGDGMSDLVVFNRDLNGIDVYRSLGNGFASKEDWWINTSGVSFPDSVVMLSDVNADGNNDLILFDPFQPTASSAWDLDMLVWISTAHEFVPGWSKSAVANYPAGYVAQGFYFREGDFNGDGLSDLLQIGDYLGAPAKVWFSRGSYHSDPVIWTTKSGEEPDVVIADPDGDGRSDYVRFPDISGVNPAYVSTANSAPFPDLVSNITDGLGAQINFAYKPTTDPSVYLGPTSTLLPPNTFHAKSPRYVVSNASKSNGLGGLYQYTFTYEGAKYHQSYGFLGFRTISRSDLQLGTILYSTYRQDFPLVGLMENQSLVTTSNVGLYDSNTNWKALHTATTPQVWSVRKESSTETWWEFTGNPKGVVRNSYQYDDFANVTKHTTEWGDLTNFSSRTTLTSFYNNIPTWILGLPQQLTLTDTPFQQSSQSRHTIFVFDQVTRLLNSRTEDWTYQSVPTSRTSSFGYDDYGNITSINRQGSDVQAGTATETMIYDSYGRFIVSYVDPVGLGEHYTFSPKWGKITSYTDPNGNTVTTSYDKFGRLLNQIRPDNTKSKYFYCAGPIFNLPKFPDHSVTAVLESASELPTHIRYYDNLGRELRDLSTGFNDSFIKVDTVYDQNLRIARKSDPYFHYSGGIAALTPWTDYQYDVLGRPTGTATNYGAFELYSYGVNPNPLPNPLFSQSFLTRYVRVDNELNQSRIAIINGADQIIQVVDGDLSSTTPESSITSYEYGAFGTLNRVADSYGNIVQATYDSMGRRRTLVDPDRGNLSFDYDAFGQIISQTDGLGRTISFNYDLSGRMVQRLQPNGTLSGWDYDTSTNGLGKLARRYSMGQGNDFDETYSYNSLGNVTLQHTDIRGSVFDTQFDYGPNAQVIEIKYPGAYSIKNEYDKNGILKEVRETSTLTSLWKANDYTARRQIQSQTLGNGITSTFDYSTTQGTLQGISSTFGSNIIQLLQYGIDSRNNLLVRDDGLQNRYENLQYDSFNRLKYRELITSTQSYQPILSSFDLIGNVTSQSNLGAYSYVGAQPHAVKSITSFGGFSYNTIGELLSSPGRTITWRWFGKPQEAWGTSNHYRFYYDDQFRRTWVEWELSGANQWNTLLSPNRYFDQLIDLSSNFEYRNYIYVGDQKIAVVTQKSTGSSDIKYFLYDNLGSLSVISDANAALLENLSYDSWGKRRNSDWTPATSIISSSQFHGFEGHFHFEDLGLIDMNGRFYDPTIARFISPDPFIPDPLNSQALNHYSFVYNSPTALTDPSGFLPKGYDDNGDEPGGEWFLADDGKWYRSSFDDVEVIAYKDSSFFNQSAAGWAMSDYAFSHPGFINGFQFLGNTIAFGDRNFFGYYGGPWNPSDYSINPQHIGDHFAMVHDLNYDRNLVAGGAGVFNNLDVTGGDLYLGLHNLYHGLTDEKLSAQDRFWTSASGLFFTGVAGAKLSFGLIRSELNDTTRNHSRAWEFLSNVANQYQYCDSVSCANINRVGK